MEEDTQPSALPSSEPLLTWQATTHVVHERGMKWYIAAGIVLLAGIAYGLYSGAWSLIVVLVLCGLMYGMLHNHVPALKTIVISEEGVKLDDKFERWDQFKGFWIIETPINSELHIAPKNRKQDEIIMQLNGVQPELVKQVLGPLTEEIREKKETLIDKFIRICKL